MKATKLLSILFIAGTLTLGLTVSQSVFGSDDGVGPPGDPHMNPPDEFPPRNPHETATGDPKHGSAPGDPHPGAARGDPHSFGTTPDTGNPHVGDPRPAHSKVGGFPGGVGPFASTSSASFSEPTFTVFPGEPVANGYAGEPKFNDFPGEPFSNVSFSES